MQPQLSKPMKARLLILIFVFVSFALPCGAQLCPGGGANFTSAVSFDPSWIYGCNTGTSCNGGIAFDNRSSCIPITSLDACAPPPSCAVLANSASNVWFSFYASAPNAIISCFQNTSLVLGVQAFSGGLLCGSLSQIGCALAGGPSSGVNLSLSGLLPGKLYYFRIFGSSNPVSQRTGLYCFCGSSGLGEFNILPLIVSSFTADASSGKVNLAFTVEDAENIQALEMERSIDGTNFSSVSTIPVTPGTRKKIYHFTDESPSNGNNYYRLKLHSIDGHVASTRMVGTSTRQQNEFLIMGNQVRHSLLVSVKNPSVFLLLDAAGHVLKTIQLDAGIQSVSVESFSNGFYCLQPAKGGASQKFYIAR